MSGFQQFLKAALGVNTFEQYTATVTVGYYADAETTAYGFYPFSTPDAGSVASESGGTLTYFYVQSVNGGSSWTTYLDIQGLEGGTKANVTVGGVFRNDGGYTSVSGPGTPSGRWQWSGDVFSLAAKNGQSLAVIVQVTS